MERTLLARTSAATRVSCCSKRVLDHHLYRLLGAPFGDARRKTMLVLPGMRMKTCEAELGRECNARLKAGHALDHEHRREARAFFVTTQTRADAIATKLRGNGRLQLLELG